MAKGIIYPEKGTNGDNLLSETPVIIKPRPMIYSLRVDIEEGNKMKVIMPVPGDPDNTWSFFRYCGMSVGWKHVPVAGVSGHEMHFLAEFPGHADLPAYFIGHNAIEIKIFENDEENPARIKTIKW